MLYGGVLCFIVAQPVRGLHGDLPGCHVVLLARVVRRPRRWEHAGEDSCMDHDRSKLQFFLYAGDQQLAEALHI